jgi:hypothetical protein
VAEHHRPEAERRDLQARASEVAVFHGVLPRRRPHAKEYAEQLDFAASIRGIDEDGRRGVRFGGAMIKKGREIAAVLLLVLANGLK